MPEFQHVDGLAEMLAALDELPKRVAKNVIRGAIRAGSRVILQQIVNFAPQYTGPEQEGHAPPGTLKRAIRMYYVRGNDANLQSFSIDIRHGTGPKGTAKTVVKRDKATGKVTAAVVDAYYAKWVEFGSSKWGGNPFFMKGFLSSKDSAIEAFQEYAGKRIEKEAEALSNKH